MFNSLEHYKNVTKGDKLSIATNTGSNWTGAYFEEQTPTAIKVHIYEHNQYVTIEKNTITELFNDSKNIIVPLYKLTRNVPSNKYSTFEFLNEQHEVNYDRLLQKWKKGETSTEYASAMYIFALPLIFEKFESSFETMYSPVTWIVDYERKYNDDTAKQHELTQAERDEIVIGYDLTSSMVQLGKLATHLFNGYRQFHLLDCLSTLDNSNYFAFTQALAIRR